MPTNDRGIREVTEAVDFAVVGDRLHFTLRSGECARTYAISFHRARSAALVAMRMLDEHDREARKVLPFG